MREVATQGSFSGAAESLSYTQSAVSQQIAVLEREAGMKLVERGARGVRLTDAGETLVGHTDAILARLRAAEQDLEAIAGLRGGNLRMVAFPSAGSSIVPVAVARFRERYPDVALSLEPAEPEEALASLRAGACDVAIIIETPFRPTPDDSIERRVLLDDEMFVALPRAHRLAGSERVRLQELRDEAFIQGATQTCPDTSILMSACERAGFEPRIAFHSDDYGAIQGFIAAGVGVALIPDLALTSVREDIVIRRLAGKSPIRRIVAATLDGCNRAPASRAMVDVLAEVGAGWGAAEERLALVC